MNRYEKQIELEKQFRKKLQIFDNKFPTEESCIEKLYKITKKNKKIKCDYCGSHNHEREYGSRVNTCKDCLKQTWFTSETFFHRIRKIRAWFGVIWLREQGIFISSNKIHLAFVVAQSTAALINKKLNKLIEEQFDESATTIQSSFFKSLICRRSKETPAFEHPSIQTFKQKNHKERKEKCKITEAVQYTDQENTVLGALSSTPQNLESLSKKIQLSVKDIVSTITMLEIAGAVKRFPGDHYALPNKDKKGTDDSKLKKLSSATKSEIKEILEFIKLVYQGISWRYLQIYLASYWCYAARKKFGSGKLFTLCLKSKPVDSYNLVSCTSSKTVKLMPAAA